MKWLVTIQDDQAKTISFEVEATVLTWTSVKALFSDPAFSKPEFAIDSCRLVKVENAENAA
jgi:hypothetical protein